MSRINWSRVLVGGLVAGVVLNVVDWAVFGVWLARDFAAAMQAAGKPQPNNMIPLFILLDFVYGITLVWLYAAIRPRFGAGAKTAVVAGFVVWFLIAFLHAVGEAPMQLIPQRIYTLSTAAAFLEYPIAAIVGASLYKEGAMTGSQT